MRLILVVVFGRATGAGPIRAEERAAMAEHVAATASQSSFCFRKLRRFLRPRSNFCLTKQVPPPFHTLLTTLPL